MPDSGFPLRFKATGIGSVPFLDIPRTCQSILDCLPDIPFWPQFVQRSDVEDMSIQFSEGLPLLEIHHEKRSLGVRLSPDRESHLVDFYDHFLAQDLNYFALSEAFAPGFYAMLRLLNEKASSHYGFVKGQSIGPITFTAGISGPDGKSVLHNQELLEAYTQGLAIKALWQIRQLADGGRSPILFLDEPYLSGFGSAFSPVGREEVIGILRIVIEYLKRNAEVLIGIHCCGNTDWGMLLEAGPDVINFDAFGYLDQFLLYPKEIKDFINRGGYIAWGIVPTLESTGDETAEGLLALLKKGIARTRSWGIDSEQIAEKSILTPSCGMGTMSPKAAQSALSLLSKLSALCAEDESVAIS